ncbi:SRPBCC family protein [Actinokineospora bangkokensis]|uniref:Polyketide cyclase n=1 Tax=Actinokineospora bangkokensis TaxID=1193682 RepID=A0A1Q9LJX7_9PSEU|nr:SRPBCC domain-containing protein [Actinokineospora bangkokensis]OLR92357.1 polyketide cyclase [Actinokineospora bangkokensis]
MTVIDVQKDPEALTLTFTAEFTAPVERVWQVWEDPRQLERWWGPPTWPATFTEHNVKPGGRSAYYMTGPEGERAGGWWEFTAVDAPHSLAFRDGFADADGNPNPAMPTTEATVVLEATPTGTRMTTTSRFSSLEHLEQLLEMGMQEGMRLAMGQIDELLAA